MDALRRFLAQLRAYWAGLSRLRRAALVAAGVGVLLALGAVAYLTPGLEYRPLFPTELPPEEVGAITTRLQAQGVPFKLNPTGTSILVPEDRLAQARVALAAEGLPTRGGKGYELFDETSLMTTPFVQSVNYQRALQAELGRSIMQLEPVQSARVLIARPEPSPFVRDQRPPTASVVLKLKPGAAMSRATAAGIVSLVARSVEGLKPENVTVVDSGGRLLSDPHAGDHDTLPAPQLEYRRDLETYLSTKAEEMLAQHLGPGRAVVRVSADVNFQQVKERRETYYPEEKAVGAEMLTTSKSSGGAAGGVVGATSNVARAGGPLTAQRGAGGSTSQEETVRTDYLVSKSVRDQEDRMGGVTRLTVAAMVDLSASNGGTAVISADDAQEIIKQAVGFRTGRDEVKLTNVHLTGPPPTPEPDEETVRLQRFQVYVGLARNLSLALAVVLAAAIVPLLLLRRRRPAPPPPAPAEPPPLVAEDRRRTDLDRLAEMTRADPDRVTEVFRLLIGQPSR
ncbi:MAG: fliF [Gemmataceae bacterium]|nr:fliF [Gemmataceae bacterium]